MFNNVQQSIMGTDRVLGVVLVRIAENIKGRSVVGKSHTQTIGNQKCGRVSEMPGKPGYPRSSAGGVGDGDLEQEMPQLEWSMKRACQVTK